ncbi:hypothetical protein BJ508DRAFT_330228 [Ascobolus immersus RN42]|uniref:Uncharacterized protein n=1 Tax=Ascobolus immersus RN42 TaxID=1160509 RepID=A0A3N4I6C9_ASCIM|nr:hypothetical protein BJ508DRAFT_330228 [Ascobolus immersus RN42]
MQFEILTLLFTLLAVTLARSVDTSDCTRLDKRAGGKHSDLAKSVMHNAMANEAEKHWWDVFLAGCGQNRKDEMTRQGVPTEEQLTRMRNVQPVEISDAKFSSHRK